MRLEGVDVNEEETLSDPQLLTEVCVGALFDVNLKLQVFIDLSEVPFREFFFSLTIRRFIRR